MAELRHRAVHRKAGELRDGARHLERLTRDDPHLSKLVGGARHLLDRAEIRAEGRAGRVDCTLTAVDAEELRRRSVHDDAALAEWLRREELPLAA